MLVSRVTYLLRFLLLVPCSANFSSFAVLNFDLKPLQLRGATVIYLASTTASVPQCSKYLQKKVREIVWLSLCVSVFSGNHRELHYLFSKILSVVSYIFMQFMVVSLIQYHIPVLYYGWKQKS